MIRAYGDNNPTLQQGWHNYHVTCKERATGREVTMFVAASVEGQQLIDQLGKGYRNLDFSDAKIGDAVDAPSRPLKEIPGKYFQSGIIEAVKAELRQKKEAAVPRIALPSRFSAGRNLLQS